jgi:hypothetical protein
MPRVMNVDKNPYPAHRPNCVDFTGSVIEFVCKMGGVADLECID